jgi:hypothetical protein
MIAQLREGVRQWRFTRNLLIVDFGSGPGRVPLVMLSRSEVADVVHRGTQVSFSSRSAEHHSWRFVVHTTTSAAADRISRELRCRVRHILEPLGEITCIVHSRPEEEGIARPRWIGGDISIAGVPQPEYWRNANGAWVLKAVFTEPSAPPNGGPTKSPGNSGVTEGPPPVS